MATAIAGSDRKMLRSGPRNLTERTVMAAMRRIPAGRNLPAIRQLFANFVEKLRQSLDAEFYLRFEAWCVSLICGDSDLLSKPRSDGSPGRTSGF
jgi:hypothetical protein